MSDIDIDDDQVAELFAAANPFPDHEIRDLDAPSTRPRSTSTAIDLAATDVGPSSDRSRVWLLALVAGIVGLAVGAVIAFSQRDGAVAPADTTPTPATIATERAVEEGPTSVDAEPAAAGTDAVRIAEEFLSAVARRDVAATEALLAADYLPSIAPSSDDASRPSIASQLAWLDAWDWSWTLDSCGFSAVDRRVSCSAEGGNLLTEQAGESGRFSAVLQVTDDVVTDFSWSYEGRGFDRIYGRFESWVASVHPADAGVMWPYRDGDWTASSSPAATEMFRERLAEYTATDTPPPGVPALYVDAARRGAVAELDALLLPDAELADFWATSVSDYVATARVLDALRIDTLFTYCKVSPNDGWLSVTHDCSLELENGWGAGDVDLPLTARAVFELQNGQISTVRSSGEDRIIEQLSPWFDWLDDRHPGDTDVMFETLDGTRRPRLTDDAIELIRLRVDEYLADAAD